MSNIKLHSCWNKPNSPNPLMVEGKCIVCGRKIYGYECKVCGGIFYCDVSYEKDHVIKCPIHDEDVVVDDNHDQGNSKSLTRYISILFAIGIVVAFILFLLWIIPQIGNAISVIGSEISEASAAIQFQLADTTDAVRGATPLVLDVATETLKSVAKAVLFLGVILLFVLILIVRPTRDFDDIYMNARG